MLEIHEKIMNFNIIHRKRSGESIRKLLNRTIGKLAKDLAGRKGKEVNKKERS